MVVRMDHIESLARKQLPDGPQVRRCGRNPEPLEVVRNSESRQFHRRQPHDVYTAEDFSCRGIRKLSCHDDNTMASRSQCLGKMKSHLSRTGVYGWEQICEHADLHEICGLSESLRGALHAALNASATLA